jgi:hypothetical protein
MNVKLCEVPDTVCFTCKATAISSMDYNCQKLFDSAIIIIIITIFILTKFVIYFMCRKFVEKKVVYTI